MTCTEADNVYAMAIEGSFDDAQTALKDIFADQEYRTNHRLSAVNSINLARVLAQCVYYLSAWLRVPKARQDNVEFVVPTGNFGNVLAGWMLQKMGVPIRSFKVATNQNDILYRLFSSGEYRIDQVVPSLAPSMDIQVSSNFERFLYYNLGQDPTRVREVMTTFKQTGSYQFTDFDKDIFSASRCPDGQIPEIIRAVHAKFDYVVDPHTACAFADIDPNRLSIVLATAHPAKFPDTIQSAIGLTPTHPSLEKLKARPIIKHPVAATADAIRAFIEARAV
jgi:threonine synthase